MLFWSKKDFRTIFLCIIAVVISWLPAIFIGGLFGWLYYVVAALITFFIGQYLLFTRYKIKNGKLTLYSFCARFSITTDRIKNITECKNMYLSFATSKKRLEISFGLRNGSKWTTVYVSPKKQDLFIEALLKEKPNICVSLDSKPNKKVETEKTTEEIVSFVASPTVEVLPAEKVSSEEIAIAEVPSSEKAPAESVAITEIPSAEKVPAETFETVAIAEVPSAEKVSFETIAIAEVPSAEKISDESTVIAEVLPTVKASCDNSVATEILPDTKLSNETIVTTETKPKKRNSKKAAASNAPVENKVLSDNDKFKDFSFDDLISDAKTKDINPSTDDENK